MLRSLKLMSPRRKLYNHRQDLLVLPANSFFRLGVRARFAKPTKRHERIPWGQLVFHNHPLSITAPEIHNIIVLFARARVKG